MGGQGSFPSGSFAEVSLTRSVYRPDDSSASLGSRKTRVPDESLPTRPVGLVGQVVRDRRRVFSSFLPFYLFFLPPFVLSGLSGLVRRGLSTQVVSL